MVKISKIRAISRNKEFIMIIEKELLENTFKGNIFETAVELRCSVQTIMASLIKHNIKFEKPKHIFSDLKKTEFSLYQKNLLVGGLLGDSCVYKKFNTRNAVLEFNHTVKQTDWAMWKANNLKPFFYDTAIVNVKGVKHHRFEDIRGIHYSDTSDTIRICLNSHPYFSELRNIFYPNGKKIIPINYLETYFNMDSLAVLIGDDGCLISNGYSIKICTQGFTKTDVFLLAEFLKKFHRGTISVKEAKYLKGIKYYIYMGVMAGNKEFVRAIKNRLPKCMHYKIPLVLNEHQVATHNE